MTIDSLLIRIHGPVPEFGYDMWAVTHQDLANTGRVRASQRSPTATESESH